LVPITGFSNAVTSPALEAKTEGYVLGVGAKIFTIAGPVILFGTVASIVAGAFIYFSM
ncbi:MAG: SpoVA/SpoVAEb family sporulation membrane protein, partial [Clostridia bacterium]|nr:SpoVA/SpoVAEb family sporulation membrane protein [Clostridia bacterium]